jgi:MFS family permease
MDLKLLSFLLLVYSTNLGVIITLTPLYSESLGADEMFVGLIVSAYAIAYTVSAPVWGKASDILGRKLTISLGMFGYSISAFLLAFASSPIQVLVIRMLGGLTDSSFWTVPTALMADLYEPKERGIALGKIGTVQLAGLIVGPSLGGLLKARFSDYGSIFYICSALIFSTALLVFFGLKEEPRVASKDAQIPLETQREFGSEARKSLAVAYVNMAFTSIAFGVLVSQFIVHANAILGSGKEYLVGLLLTGYYVAEAVVQPAAGKLSDKTSPYRTTQLAYVTCALGFFILIFAQSPLSLLVAVVFAGLGVGTLYVTLTVTLMDLARSSERGFVSGVQNIAWGAGYFVGPLVGGIVAAYSVSAPYIFCAIAAAAGGLLTSLYLKSD